VLESWLLIIYLATPSAGGPATIGPFPSFDHCMTAARNVEAEYASPRSASVWGGRVYLISFNCVQIS
jgi:hypothetical protein